MIYYNENDILIRTMEESDVKIITEEERAQGWNQTEDKYWMRIHDSAVGKAIALVAEYQRAVAGYINIYPNADAGPFSGKGYCEIVDFGVLEKFRCRGIGTKLMDVAEQIASEYADMVYLGVGLYDSYGAAQRIYVKRGYIPDGSGIWYGDKPAVPYEIYRNDDDLNLYLSKKL